MRETRKNIFRDVLQTNSVFLINLGLLLACIAFFACFPGFDILISQYFYNKDLGAFYGEGKSFFSFIYSLTHFISGVILFGIPTLLLAARIFKIKPVLLYRNHLIFILAALLLGPGLVVNSGFKEHWGRPRPVQTLEFGGSKEFQGALYPDFECSKCHSFVSGHASVGFYFFTLYFLFRKRRLLIIPFALGSLIGFTRIVQGGHYFSDILFSGWAVWISSMLLYKLFVRFKLLHVPE